MTFAENLKELRKKKNMTQEALANEISVSRTLITKYESGAVPPTEENLKKLAGFFGVGMKDLLSGDEETALALKAVDSTRTLNMTAALATLIVSLGFFVVVSIPIFKYGHLVANADGTQSYVHGMTSLLSAFFRYGNPLGFITVLFAFSGSCLSTASLVLKDAGKAKAVRIINGIVFGVTIVLFLTTAIYGYQLIHAEDFRMNAVGGA
jgi:transcriptional regulator with XRE-family HTH domain